MNDTLHNGDVSNGIDLLNGHTLPQYNESSKQNEMNTSVENGDVNGDYFYINSYTKSVINNHNSINHTNKRYEISNKNI